MRYMGGKTRIAEQIAAIMRAKRGGRSTYVEPFLGGGSVAAQMAPAFPSAYLSDANENLVLLWQAIQNGWVPPARVTEPEWQALKHAEPSALRAFAGFGGSFGGAWFKSYAKNGPGNDYIGASRRALLRYKPKIAHATISHHDYTEAGRVITADALVYCDPPYAGTDAYDAAGGVGGFHSPSFWTTARRWSDLGAAVLVSEYSAPADWVPVWRLKVPVTINKDSNTDKKVEQLFMHAPALERMKR